MRNLSVRNIPPDLSEALEEEKHRRRQSLNKTVIDLLRQSLGLSPRAVRSNGLRGLGGNWTEEEFQEFVEAVAQTEVIDEELWR